MQPTMLDMVFVKSTKNTHVFKSNDENSVVPTIYINKSAFKTEKPHMVKLIISDTYDSDLV